MDDRTFHELVEIEAYCIYKTRMSWTPPIPGDDVSDWLDAERKIRHQQLDDIISPNVVNRIGNLV